MKGLKRTKMGYDPYECLSVIHKAIRRGDEELALYFALEMERSGYWSWVRNRFRILAYENTSIADPQVVMFVVQALKDADEMHKIKGDSWRVALASAVLALARSKKSMIADHFQAAIMDELEHKLPKEIPDYAIDKHTIRGKRMGRGVEHFIEIGSRLENEKEVHNPYKDRAIEYWRKMEKGGNNYNETEPEKENGQTGLFD